MFELYPALVGPQRRLSFRNSADASASVKTGGHRFSRPWSFVLVAIIVIAFAVPTMIRHRELALVSRSHQFLTSVRDSQDQYFRNHQRYAASLDQLGLREHAPAEFAVGIVMAGHSGSLESSWSLTLTRLETVVACQPYTMTYDNHGFCPGSSSVQTILGERSMRIPLAICTTQE